MFFDQLCGSIERYFPDFMPLFEQAKIFVFEGIAHEVLPKKFTREEADELEFNFFLPFPVTVVEDAGSCILLEDVVHGQRGLHCERRWIELMTADSPLEAFNDTANYGEKELSFLKSLAGSGLCQIYFGRISNISHKNDELSGYNIDAYVIASFEFNKKKILRKNIHLQDPANPKSKMIEEMKPMLRNPVTAIEEIFYFNQSGRFILETRNLKNRHRSNKKRKKLLRSNERPLYTILRPEQIRNIMNLPHPETGGKETRSSEYSGDVRAHVKWLRHQKWKIDPVTGEELEQKPIPWGPDKGLPYYRRVDVDSYWRGKTEAIVGNKFYKVRTDL